MNKKNRCGVDFSDAAVPEKLFINFFWPYFLFQSIKAYCVYQTIQVFKLILFSLIPHLILYHHQEIQQNRDYKNTLKHSLWKRTKYSLIDKVTQRRNINTLPAKTQQGKKNTKVYILKNLLITISIWNYIKLLYKGIQ